jgi:L-ascorbate 6-phosphate lactonase
MEETPFAARRDFRFDPAGTSNSGLMASIRGTTIPSDGIGVWFLGQNGFVLKSAQGLTIAIDPYLSDSCRTKFAGSQFDLSRCLPVFLEPEDLDVEFFVVTHSHEDHLDEETVKRLRCRPTFIAPWEAHERLLSFDLPRERCHLLHPNEAITLGDVRVHATFALPTDATDLNHIGVLFEFANGVRFYNTGDSAYAEALERLLPKDVDICAICINGGFHNLDHKEAAKLIHAVRPCVAIPTHYDMMMCNCNDPETFRSAVRRASPDTSVHIMEYDRPFIYRREK